MSFLSFLFPRTITRTHSGYNRDIEVREVHGKNTLLVNGIQQTGSYTAALWTKGLQKIFAQIQGAPARILVLGVGGGGVFHILHTRYPAARITGVDIDPEIIRLANGYFGLAKKKYIRLIESDARLFAKNNAYKHSFDLIVIDLYVGNEVPAFVPTREFLVNIRALLVPGGAMVMNYYTAKNMQHESERLRDTLSGLYPYAENYPVLRNVFFLCS